MKTIIVISGILTISVLLITANSFLPKIELINGIGDFASNILRFQIFSLSLAVVATLLTILSSPKSKSLLRFGELQNVPAREIWLGLNGKRTWRSNSLILLTIISIGTGTFMFMALKYTNHLNFDNFQWYYVFFIVLFSTTNSLAEEIFYRFVIIGNLKESLPKTVILIISGLFFGLPHYFGFPTGVIGILMAGVLGYVLAKATYETNGIGIAWGIHFVQDIIIFTALFMMN